MTNFNISTADNPTLLTPDSALETSIVEPATAESEALALVIAQAADERKGGDITVLKVATVSYLTDYFVIATGFSQAQVRAIARSIEDAVQEQYQRLPRHVEGQGDGGWVLLDYGEVIAHLFMPREREFYNLEAFWGHAERIPFAPALTLQSSLELLED